MNTLTLTGASMVALLSAMGCGGAGPSDTSPSDEAPTATSAAGTGSTPAQPLVSIQGFVHASDGSPLAGATVCPEVVGAAKNAASCTASGGDGSFTLAAPANEWVAVTFDKTGFVSTVRAVATQTGVVALPGTENVMLPAVEPLMIAGVPADPGMGQVAFSVMGPTGQNGVAASVTLGGSGSPPPAIYLDSAGSPDVGATSGTEGRFVNVPPGLYSLHFNQASATCAPLSLYGWPMTAYQSAGEASVVVPVMAGYVTAPVAASCVSAE
ncbi:MAG: carboxypeptidase-like regulatory domain-containing protein [Polyangiaceae bacterium]